MSAVLEACLRNEHLQFLLAHILRDFRKCNQEQCVLSVECQLYDTPVASFCYCAAGPLDERHSMLAAPASGGAPESFPENCQLIVKEGTSSSLEGTEALAFSSLPGKVSTLRGSPVFHPSVCLQRALRRCRTPTASPACKTGSQHGTLRRSSQISAFAMYLTLCPGGTSAILTSSCNT